MPERPSPGPEFLKKKYDLHKAPEVGKAAKRAEARTGEKVSQAEVRIEAYLDRLEKLTLDPKKEQKRKTMGKEGEVRPRALSLLREMVMNRYVRSNKEKMTESAVRVEERAAADMGIEGAEYGQAQREQRGDIAVTDVEGSLDQWITYLSDQNEPYPTWFRYYTFRNVLDLGEYDKDKGEFPKRSAGTIKLFPDIDRGALAYVEDMIEASKDPEALNRLRNAQQAAQTPAEHMLTKEKAAAFAKLPFAKQYAEGIGQAGEITPELRKETRGEWKTFQRGTDPTPLWASLQNKGTAWCTKGFGTAQTQLQGGDFLVYYTLDRQGKPAIPRLAIRMQGNEIGEIRGVADTDQNVEENLAEIADKKLKTIPGAERYLEASRDTKLLKKLFQKTEKDERLTREELVFLYEIEKPIQGFGYKKHPRINELRSRRNPKEDAPVVLGVKPEEIAWGKENVTDKTKSYVGPLFKGVFDLKLEHLYATFPAREITTTALEIGGKDAKQLEAEHAKAGFQINDWAKQLLEKAKLSKERKETDIVRLTVADLGFPQGATNAEIWKRGKELGLDLCPPDVGPELRLSMKDQPLGDYVVVAMEAISDSDGPPRVFGVDAGEDGRWLSTHDGGPGGRWDPDGPFVFARRKQP